MRRLFSPRDASRSMLTLLSVMMPWYENGSHRCVLFPGYIVHRLLTHPLFSHPFLLAVVGVMRMMIMMAKWLCLAQRRVEIGARRVESLIEEPWVSASWGGSRTSWYVSRMMRSSSERAGAMKVTRMGVWNGWNSWSHLRVVERDSSRIKHSG